MSLLVWLPFNGNLNNLGLSDLNITLSSGNELVTDTKIGGGSLKLTKRQIISTTIFNGKKLFSWAYWVKVNTAWSANWLDSIYWVTSDGTNTDANRSEFYTDCTKVGMWYKGGSISGYNFTPGVWTHLAGTVDYENGKAAFYINGVQLGNTTSNVDTTRYITSVYLGDSGIDICENDVRLYDHILSKKEIKELSKGLVLHYKLDEGNSNLLYTTPKRLVPSDYNAYLLLMTENLAANLTYTLLLWDVDVYHSAKTAAQTGVWIYWGGGNVHLFNWAGPTYFTQCGGNNYHADYLVKTFTVTSSLASGNGATNLWLNIYNSVPTADGTRSMRIGSWKLEKGSVTTPWRDSADNTIYDSSGYGNHGTLVGSTIVDTNTIRYDYSMKLTNGLYVRVDKRPAECLPKDAITVNIWQYATSWSNPISCTEGGGWNFENSSGIRFPVYISSVGYKIAQSTITPASTQNAWHMLTGTMDKDNIKIYYDGELLGTTVNGSTNGIGYANNYLFIGAEAQGNNTTPASSSYAGNLSDIRIYATALTDDQIKELYNTSVTIDNNGNIYTRELVEYE